MNGIVIGGGIGGLTASIALERCGIRTDVYERAPELREVGAGITLWANALGALDTLGIARESLHRAPPGPDGGLRTNDGALITKATFEGFTRRFGAACVDRVAKCREHAGRAGDRGRELGARQALRHRPARRRARLLGDAAHAMTPNLGQGACQAIEDGVELAALLAGSDDISASLRRYEQRRMERTRRVVVQSRRIGAIGQWENPLLCAVRNALFRLMPGGATEHQLEWIVGYRALTAAGAA